MAAFPLEQPAFGQVRVADELKKRAISVSPAGVRTIWLRHDLQTFQQRLKALSAKVAQDCDHPTEDQVRALEKAKREKEAHGEIAGASWRSGIAGHLLHRQPQGRRQDLPADVCRRPHTYSKLAFVKLYDRENAITRWTCLTIACCHSSTSTA